MENASKALLIAAGILIGLIIITMIIFGYNQVSNYYTNKEETRQGEQLTAFNKQYIGYNRDNVRGSDLLSLVNKIIDYNVDKMNYVNEEKIEISISINNVEAFYYDYANNKNIRLIESKYTEANLNSSLVAPAYRDIENHYSQAIATKLTSKMSTLMGENSRQTPEELLKELKVDESEYGGLKKIQEDMLKYYQYLQFKRAHFDCTGLTYKDGRVKSFTFVFNGTFE